MNIPDELTDPALERYARRMEKIYTTPELPRDLTWQDLQYRRVRVNLPGRRVTSLRWVRPARQLPTRVALIMAVLAVVLMAAGFAYAIDLFSPKLTHDLQSYPGTHNVLAKQEFVKVNQSKTIDGFTLTLETAYADANRAVLGYSIIMPKEFKNDGHWWAFDRDSLRTASGLALPGLSSVGVRAVTDVISYDAGVIRGTPATLQLHAEITFGCDSSQDAQGQVNTCPPKALHISNDLHWSFDFSVPFHAGQVVNVHTSATTHGKTVTLDRVVITASETRVYLRGADSGLTYSYDATLTVAHQAYSYYSWSQPNSSGDQYVVFDQGLLGKHGWWVLDLHLSIETLVNNKPQSHDGGHLVFHFQVP